MNVKQEGTRLQYSIITFREFKFGNDILTIRPNSKRSCT